MLTELSLSANHCAVEEAARASLTFVPGKIPLSSSALVLAAQSFLSRFSMNFLHFLSSRIRRRASLHAGPAQPLVLPSVIVAAVFQSGVQSNSGDSSQPGSQQNSWPGPPPPSPGHHQSSLQIIVS